MYARAATKKGAERHQARLVTEVADGRHKGTDVKTVGALVGRYLDWCEHDITCRLHDLRHFMVTNVLEGGVALPTVAGRAGAAGPG